jgi:hypothetical protein
MDDIVKEIQTDCYDDLDCSLAGSFEVLRIEKCCEHYDFAYVLFTRELSDDQEIAEAHGLESLEANLLRQFETELKNTPWEEFNVVRAPSFERPKSEPAVVGRWILVVDPTGDVSHWGQQGRAEFPYLPEQETEMLQEARHLAKESNVWILDIFPDGRMKRWEVE